MSSAARFKARREGNLDVNGRGIDRGAMEYGGRHVVEGALFWALGRHSLRYPKRICIVQLIYNKSSLFNLASYFV